MAEHDNEQPKRPDADVTQSPDSADSNAQELPDAGGTTGDADAQEMRGGESGDEPRSSAESSEESTSEGEPTAEAMTEEALGEVEGAARNLQDHAERSVEDTLNLPDFGGSSDGDAQSPQGMGLLSDVSMNVTIELGRTRMYVEDVLKLNAHSIVELDKAAGDPVDIYVNDCHVARGEVLVLNENFCVRVSEIVASPPRVTRQQ